MGEIALPITDKNAPLMIRNLIQELEIHMAEMPGALVGDSCPLKHSFAKGLYIREITMPANMLFVTKLHKYSHAAFLLSGAVSVLEEGGARYITAPASFITQAGTKRIVYTHTDSVWTTVHSTDKMDLKEIEEEIIAKGFSEISAEDDENHNAYREVLRCLGQ
jgi:hypothetical protein